MNYYFLEPQTKWASPKVSYFQSFGSGKRLNGSRNDLRVKKIGSGFQPREKKMAPDPTPKKMIRTLIRPQRKFQEPDPPPKIIPEPDPIFF